MKQGKTNPNSGLRALIDELYARVRDASSSLIGSIASIVALYASPFTAVAHTTMPTSSSAWKFVTDTSLGPVNITLTGMPVQNQLLMVSVIGTASNPVNITVPTVGTTIWNPSTGAFAASATIVNGPGSVAWWQYDAPNNRFIEVV